MSSRRRSLSISGRIAIGFSLLFSLFSLPAAAQITLAEYGDSVTIGTYGGATESQTFRKLLANDLGAIDCNVALPSSSVNAAVNATNALELQTRIDQIGAMCPNPSIIILNGGETDYYTQPATLGNGQFRAAYDRMLSRLVSTFPTTPVLIWGPLDTPWLPDASGWRAAAMQSILANGSPNLHYLDPTGWLDLTFNGPDFGGDLHPNAHGNLVIEQKLKPVVSSLIAAPATPEPSSLSYIIALSVCGAWMARMQRRRSRRA